MWKMASRAYVASMTVAELTTELKQRGLSTKGRKKTLMERLEKVTNPIVALHKNYLQFGHQFAGI